MFIQVTGFVSDGCSSWNIDSAAAIVAAYGLLAGVGMATLAGGLLVASSVPRARARAIGGAISLGRGTRPPEQCFSGSNGRD